MALIISALKAIAALPDILSQIRAAIEFVNEKRMEAIRLEIAEATAKLKRRDLSEADKWDIASTLQNLTRRL